MLDLFIIKSIQSILLFTSFLAWLSASANQVYSDPFTEAAKYGFAVLLLFIVVFMLWKEYQTEKTSGRHEIKELNEKITEMVDSNREALSSATAAIENSTEAIREQTQLQRELYEHMQRQSRN